MQTSPLDAEVLRRYDRPGPRYTSYPTAPQFHPDFGEEQLREVVSASNDDPIPRGLSLYVHVPFCTSPCFYCGCNRIITRDAARATTYLARLYREIATMAALFDRDREVVQLHLGGGTPNFLSTVQLGELLDTLRSHFRFARKEQDISIELDPRSITAADVLELARMGFNRASLGVQDFDPAVQVAVNRVQGVEQTREVIEACRGAGFSSVNVDLIYGLPHQAAESFGLTLGTLVSMRPDRVAVYSYAHMPELFRPQRQIDVSALPTAEAKLGLLQLAIDRLTAAGYHYIGMDHFALPGDALSQALERGVLHRNFMGYTTHADSDLVGFGPSAISHIGDSYCQNARDILDWQAAIDAGRIPVFRGMRLSQDDRLRADVIQRLMCQGEVVVAALERRYGIDFQSYFAEVLEYLQPLVADGLVLLEPGRIAVTSHGRVFLRNIAMCFDRYLSHAPSEPRPRFSRVI